MAWDYTQVRDKYVSLRKELKGWMSDIGWKKLHDLEPNVILATDEDVNATVFIVSDRVFGFYAATSDGERGCWLQAGNTELDSIGDLPTPAVVREALERFGGYGDVEGGDWFDGKDDGTD